MPAQFPTVSRPYCSDLRELWKAAWLVAAWQDAVVNEKDERFLELDVKETPAVGESD
ncbi:hypothetical protein [Rhizobium changzhiense]|uniref:hypothetical protein n=1 Tax=Rhizobium changzhiense TaxID=2692317 RepID=UPI0015F538D7|nr:hypothetical protein [Rhizobium changzhiense]